MKYIYGIIVFVVAFVATSGVLSGGLTFNQSSGYHIDFDTATMEERQNWLSNEARQIERGLASSLPKKSKGKNVGFRIKGSSVDVDRRRIDVEVQIISNGVMMMSMTDARKMFTKKTCPTYKRSMLRDANIVLGITVLDARGGMLIRLINSPSKCERFA